MFFVPDCGVASLVRVLQQGHAAFHFPASSSAVLVIPFRSLRMALFLPLWVEGDYTVLSRHFKLRSFHIFREPK